MSEKYPDLFEVIRYIRHHLHEPLTVAELSRYAAYSPYHFIRIFKAQFGLTPQYYIASMRLQKAKELLVTTNLPVRDIALELGYQSLGTFTTRFAKCVGVTPGEFRNTSESAERYLGLLADSSLWRPRPLEHPPNNRIEGIVRSEVPFHGIVLVGLFPKPIPEGLPLYGTLVRGADSFCFAGVKPGLYYLMATSISWGMPAKEFLLPYSTLRTRSRTPIMVQSGAPVPPQEVLLHPPRLDDPPILISLPLLMRRFYQRNVHDKAKHH